MGQAGRRLRASGRQLFWGGPAGRTSLPVSRPSSALAARLFCEELIEFLVLDREALGIAFLVGGA